MKKLSYFILSSVILIFVACGSSEKEKIAIQHKKDSLKKDSITKIIDRKIKAKMDSIALVNIDKANRKYDSIKKNKHKVKPSRKRNLQQ